MDKIVTEALVRETKSVKWQRLEPVSDDPDVGSMVVKTKALSALDGGRPTRVRVTVEPI